MSNFMSFLTTGVNRDHFDSEKDGAHVSSCDETATFYVIDEISTKDVAWACSKTPFQDMVDSNSDLKDVSNEDDSKVRHIVSVFRGLSLAPIGKPIRPTVRVESPK